jgi:hypothetical protein
VIGLLRDARDQSVPRSVPSSASPRALGTIVCPNLCNFVPPSARPSAGTGFEGRGRTAEECQGIVSHPCNSVRGQMAVSGHERRIFHVRIDGGFPRKRPFFRCFHAKGPVSIGARPRYRVGALTAGGPCHEPHRTGCC